MVTKRYNGAMKNKFIFVLILSAVVSAIAPLPSRGEVALELNNPFLAAINNQDYNRTYQLLVRGANPNASDGQGRTALILASQVGFVAGVTVLLENKANVRIVDRLGNTPLMWAAAGGFDEIVEALLTAGSSVDTKNKEGQTALMLAAKYGQRNVIALLLAAKADRDLRDLTGRSATDLARQNGRKIEEELLREKSQ